MYRFSPNQDIKPLSEFRANATTCIKQIHETKRPIFITQHGKSAAVLLDVGEYEDLLDTLKLLQDIQAAKQNIKQGNVVEHTEARQILQNKIKK